MRSSWIALPYVAALATIATSAFAQEPFYKGRTISIVSPADPGGSYDLYARLLTQHMMRHLPGTPSAVVQNMPGAGGIRAINYLYNIAPRDGTALQVPAQDVALREALGRDGVDFKVTNFNWIGRVAPSVDLTVTWRTSGVKSIDDARKREVTLSATGPNSPTSVNPSALNALIGTKFKLISGYKSNAEMSAAMEKGETEGSFATWTTMKTTFPQWHRDRMVNYLVVYTTKRIHELPDVPAITELTNDPAEKQIFGFLVSTGELGRSLVAPPGVDPARVAELRAAFSETMRDPAFLADVKRLNVEFDPLSGEALQKQLAEMFEAPKEVLARTREIVLGGVRR